MNLLLVDLNVYAESHDRVKSYIRCVINFRA